MAKIKEIWKEIRGYENTYQVSNLGRFRSLDRKVNYLHGLRLHKGRILKPNLLKTGYYRIMFGDRKVRSAHRIVAEAFIPNPENKPCVNHLDGDKSNNKASNLSWVTYSENETHSYNVLGKDVTGITKCTHRVNAVAEDILKANGLYRDIAFRFKVGVGTVCKIKTGQRSVNPSNKITVA